MFWKKKLIGIVYIILLLLDLDLFCTTSSNFFIAKQKKVSNTQFAIYKNLLALPKKNINQNTSEKTAHFRQFIYSFIILFYFRGGGLSGVLFVRNFFFLRNGQTDFARNITSLYIIYSEMKAVFIMNFLLL